MLMPAYIHAHALAHAHKHAVAYTHTQMHTHRCKQEHTRTHTHGRTDTHTHSYALHTHTRPHTRPHTHTFTQVIVLENGVVVEAAHPDDLLQAQEGTFTAMVNQTGKSSSRFLKSMASDARHSIKRTPTLHKNAAAAAGLKAVHSQVGGAAADRLTVPKCGHR